MSQEDLKARLAKVRSSRHKEMVAQLEEFVRDRTDQEGLKLPSLHLLTTRDLEWLAHAIENC